MINIALTKGRLEKDTLQLFKNLGYDTSEVENKGRRLILPIKNKDINVVLSKAPDVITYIKHGVCDVGIVGKDTIMEMSGSYLEMLDLKFGKCKFAVAAKRGTDPLSLKRVATKYPNVAKKYFQSRYMDVDIIKIEGSVELAPLLNLADAIVDIVESGSTLKENNLEVLEFIADISARVIINNASLKLKKDEIVRLIDDINSLI